MLLRLRNGRRCLFILLAWFAVSGIILRDGRVLAQATPGEAALPGGASRSVAESKPADCSELPGLLQQERAAISREVGQIKREIAALRDDLSKPGLKEIFAGVGYIFGLAGIGLFLHCRRSKGPGSMTKPL